MRLMQTVITIRNRRNANETQKRSERNATDFFSFVRSFLFNRMVLIVGVSFGLRARPIHFACEPIKFNLNYFFSFRFFLPLFCCQIALCVGAVRLLARHNEKSPIRAFFSDDKTGKFRANPYVELYML